MKTKLSITVTSTILLLLSACGMTVVSGSGRIVEETRDVHSYSQVVFSAPGELTIDQNGHEGLAIEADDNLLGYIKTSVQGNVLYIEVKPDIIQLLPSRPIRYSLDADSLTRVSLNGSGDIHADKLIASDLDFNLNGSGRVLIEDAKSESTRLDLNGSGQYEFGRLITGKFTVSLNGSGDIAMDKALVKKADVMMDGSGSLKATDLIAEALDMRINGSGGSSLKGEVNHQSVTIYGSGNYDASDLQSHITSVKMFGSGDSNVWVTDELSITIAGSGDISYRGQPVITTAITGSGDLINLARQ